MAGHEQRVWPPGAGGVTKMTGIPTLDQEILVLGPEPAPVT